MHTFCQQKTEHQRLWFALTRLGSGSLNNGTIHRFLHVHYYDKHFAHQSTAVTYAIPNLLQLTLCCQMLRMR